MKLNFHTFGQAAFGGRIFWALVAFVLSLCSSTLLGRSLWCDEIIRISAQKNYTIAQLFAGDALKAFDSQSPIGYLILRPVQAVLGIEPGGFLVAALAAAVVVYFTLKTLDLLLGGERHWLVCAVVALNPIVIWFGSDLWMYEMFAAAFSWWLYELATWDDAAEGRRWALSAVSMVISGYFTVALHFSGAFIFAVTGLAMFVCEWKRHGFRPAFRIGSLMAVSLAANIPMYLAAQNAAGHLVKNTFDFAAVSRIFKFIWGYVSTFSTSLTGGGWIGVVLMLVGLILLAIRRKYLIAILLITSIFSELVYQFYISLRGYSFPAVRFWVYAAAPAMVLVGLGISSLMKRRVVGYVLGGVVLAMNVIGVLNLLTMDGRTVPYKMYADIINGMRNPQALICPNHYDTRFFNITEYLKPSGSHCLFPSYWEQGGPVRIHGLRLLRSISPLSPLFLNDSSQLEWVRKAGYSSTNLILEVRSPFFVWAKALRVFPEVHTANGELSSMMMPTESELLGESEAGKTPVFVPGETWRLVSMPPKKADQPFTPVLMLAAGKSAELKVYVPKSFAGDSVTLSGYLGRGKSAATRYSVKLDIAQKGGYVFAQIDGGKDGCYFLYPEIK